MPACGGQAGATQSGTRSSLREWNFLVASDTLAPHPEPPDGVEMQLTNVDPSLYNHDLAPIPQEKRSWGTYNYA